MLTSRRRTLLSLILVAGTAACKTASTGSSRLTGTYQPAPQGEVRLSWYTNRERDYSGRAGRSAFSATITSGVPHKGVIRFMVPADYRYAAPVIGPPTLVTDDNQFNQETAFAVYDPKYAGKATVFVHGYNNTIEDGAERAAQMFAALETPGPAQRPHLSKPFLFSWPSLGRSTGDVDLREWIRTGYPFFARAYATDEATAAASVSHLSAFLQRLCRPDLPYREVNVVAHSLGTRLVSETLAVMSRSHQRLSPPGADPATIAAGMPCRVNHLVLASGDMGLFRFRSLLPDLLLITNRITLYVNATLLEDLVTAGVTADLPLALSKLLHFFQKLELGPRIGQESVLLSMLGRQLDIVTMKRLEDGAASGGHLHIFSSPTVLRDLTHLLNGEINPRRGQRQGLDRRLWFLQ